MMSSHKKKKEAEKRDKGGYPKQKLRDAVQEILNTSLTFHAAHRKYDIPIRTLQHHVKYVTLLILNSHSQNNLQEGNVFESVCLFTGCDSCM